MTSRYHYLQNVLVAAIILLSAIGFTALVFSTMSNSSDGTNSANQNQNVGRSITYWHDDARQVSCWIYSAGVGNSISCLPDSQVQGAPNP
jgi:archaellum component FlaF (FlaF/FlaG flagellin family)